MAIESQVTESPTMVLSLAPVNLVFSLDDKPLVTFTPDRRVIVEGDIYASAKAFWDIVKTCLPRDWVMETTP